MYEIQRMINHMVKKVADAAWLSEEIDVTRLFTVGQIINNEKDFAEVPEGTILRLGWYWLRKADGWMRLDGEIQEPYVGSEIVVLGSGPVPGKPVYDPVQFLAESLWEVRNRVLEDEGFESQVLTQMNPMHEKVYRALATEIIDSVPSDVLPKRIDDREGDGWNLRMDGLYCMESNTEVVQSYSKIRDFFGIRSTSKD